MHMSEIVKQIFAFKIIIGSTVLPQSISFTSNRNFDKSLIHYASFSYLYLILKRIRAFCPKFKISCTHLKYKNKPYTN